MSRFLIRMKACVDADKLLPVASSHDPGTNEYPGVVRSPDLTTKGMINAITKMSYLQLDCTNDSTVCFRPAAGEDIEFVFRWGREMGLTPDNDVRFKVSDKDGIGVYEESLTLPDFEEPESDPNFPRLNPPDTMIIVWDGRQNIGDNAGHLADPDLGSYNSIVQVFDDWGYPIMETNFEIFDVVPYIDSVLVTHYSWYPPGDYGDNKYIYSIIRGKHDDTDDPSLDYKLYIPQNETLPTNIRLWDSDSYMFSDVLPASPAIYFYELIDESIFVENWSSDKWGDLTYKWYHVRDWGYKIGDNSYIDYEDRDTTAWWGSNWNTWIFNHAHWWEYLGHPYLRLLVRSQIVNTKNGYFLSSSISPGTSNSHKIIMSHFWGVGQDDDILYWAISQIGVPYYYTGDDPLGGKKPYIQMDCSGLVTAARIEDLEPGNNQNYRLNSNNVASYVAGSYTYNGQQVSTLTEEILPSEAFRGDLVALRSYKHLDNWDIAHIGIIDWIVADPETQYIYNAYIIHAFGHGFDPNKRRVRYDNLLGTFRPMFNGNSYNFTGGIYYYKFLHFNSE
jgi:hypothetical protein